MARRSSFTNEIVLQLASSCDEPSAENDLEIVMARANCFARSNSDRSPLYDVRNHACCSIRSGACETVLSSRTSFNAHTSGAKPSGGARRDRTDDLMLAKHALSQLSYGPVPEDECFTSIIETQCARSKWWAWEDLNFRPHAYQARALTN
jgi:hypothetical protein